MKQKDLAEALGISAAMVSRLKHQGMPTHSVEAARRWRERHLDPARVVGQRVDYPRPAAPPPEPDVAARVDLVRALMQLAAADFDQHADNLRRAMRLVPPDARAQITVDMDVFTRLLPANLTEVIEPDHEVCAAQSDAEAEIAGLVLYSLACGELELQ